MQFSSFQSFLEFKLIYFCQVAFGFFCFFVLFFPHQHNFRIKNKAQGSFRNGNRVSSGSDFTVVIHESAASTGRKKTERNKLQNRSVTPPLFSTPVHAHLHRASAWVQSGGGDPVCLRLLEDYSPKQTRVDCVSLSFPRNGAAGHARASAMLSWWMEAATDWELFYIISWLCKVLIRHWRGKVVIHAAAELRAERELRAAEARRSRTLC